MIKVSKYKVFDGNKTYEVGDTITGLSEEEESRLVSDGIAEYTNQEIKSEDISESIISDEDKNTSINGNENTNISSAAGNEENIVGSAEKNSSDNIDPNSLAMDADKYVEDTKVKK